MKVIVKQDKVDLKNPIRSILEGRGLTELWLTAGEKDLHDGRTFKNYDKAKRMLTHHIINKSEVGLLVDSDTDGFTSAAIMYQWLKNKEPGMNISPIIPEGKVHGIINELIPDNIDLLIIPDASSSEINKHKELQSKGIDVLILDHHEVKQAENPYAVIINPHLEGCPYPNKGLSGGGVVLKFIEALDKEDGFEDYKQYFDLAAVSIVADVMDLASLENKAIVNIGLNNIQNGYLKAYLKTDGRLRDIKKVTPITVGFYMAPPINALIRIGEVENKHDLFSALIGEIEPRTVTADILKIKGKQDRAKEPIVNKIAFELAKNGADRNKIILGQIPDYAHKSITGLIAGQMANMYNKPTLLGRPDNKGNWFGSARSLNNSNVEDLKDFCEESGLFNWVAGHQAAFGWSLPVENIEKFQAYAEEKLPKVEKVYYATFGHKVDEDLVAAIPILNELNDHAGPGFEEVLIYTTIDFIPSSANLIGKKSNVLTLTDHKTGLEFIKFRFNDELPEQTMTMKIVGKPNINEWQGVKKPQIIIEDYEFVELEL